MKKFKVNKKLILSVTAIVLVVAIGCGIWYYAGHNSAEPVYVYPFHYIGMTEYWGDSQESYGPVSTDKIQTVFLTDTQTVMEILVEAGDTVKKGDLLMSFDTTLSDLALERKRLDVEKLKLQLEDAEERLWEIRNMKPMRIPSFTDSDEEEDENLGIQLTEDFQLSQQKTYDGSAADKALICWIRSDVDITDTVFEAIRQTAEEYQEYNANQVPPSPSAVTEEDGEDPAPTEDPESTEETEPSEEPEPSEPVDLTVEEFYVVFKVTQNDMSLGSRKVWQGMKVTRHSSGEFGFRLVDSYISDHMMVQSGEGEDVSTPEIDFGSGYTAAQIAEMRSQQEKTIKDLEFQVKMAEANYKIMQTEVSDGNIYAQIDGQVVSVLTEEEAKMTQQPILKVSGGGGFYVEGFVSELEKDNLVMGQEVTVNDWNTGMTYTGIIESLGDFPSSNGYWNGIAISSFVNKYFTSAFALTLRFLRLLYKG